MVKPGSFNMPNNITNRLTLDKQNKKVRKFLKSDESDVDFDNIIKMPEDYYEGDRWYNWRIQNWGTKWNAYDVDVIDDEIIFNTAWSTPLPVLLLLSTKFPEVEFRLKYACEDIGYNCGAIVFKGGEILEEYTPNGGSYEALQFACDVKGIDYDEYVN
jgi:hypothetical protein